MFERLDIDGVLVIGAGLGGLSAALAAAPRPTLVVSPAPLGEGCASSWAQGGMAAAFGADDSPALHAADTMVAGVGLCDPESVAVLTREGPGAVRALAELGAPFDRAPDGRFAQSLEAAHSHPRVARVGGDGAGRAIMSAVIGAVRANSHIQLMEGARALTLIQDTSGRVLGALLQTSGGQRVEVRAAATILACGGLGGLYAVTTNPTTSRGEGLGLAWLAGAEIVDPEFVQFHPTAIAVGGDPAPLATEALRGEGARLIGAHGRPLMAGGHAEGDLAPRDVVARVIATELAAGGGAFLDARDAIGSAFPNHFPAVYAACRAAGIDPRREPIPVRPAAHYHMGGVAADLHGRTSLPGLFAVGEAAAAGVHGANRLASNSLLEAVVFGRRAGETARDCCLVSTRSMTALPAAELPAPVMAELRLRMDRFAGVVRTHNGLDTLLGWLEAQAGMLGEALPLVAARLVASAALDRQESRGAHFRADFPATAAIPIHTRLRRDDDNLRTRAA
jgi:L-aspartate oxidase